MLAETVFYNMICGFKCPFCRSISTPAYDQLVVLSLTSVKDDFPDDVLVGISRILLKCRLNWFRFVRSCVGS